MKIKERLGKEPLFSFEFFPPKDQEGVERLFETIAELRPYAPAYVSVTYGAGGSTRRLTVELVQRIKRESGIEAMAHLTCVGATREEIAGVLDELATAAIENVIALRGDPPRGAASFVRTEGGFGYAADRHPSGGGHADGRWCPDRRRRAGGSGADAAHAVHRASVGGCGLGWRSDRDRLGQAHLHHPQHRPG
jgi:hypothetical protein